MDFILKVLSSGVLTSKPTKIGFTLVLVAYSLYVLVYKQHFVVLQERQARIDTLTYKVKTLQGSVERCKLKSAELLSAIKQESVKSDLTESIDMLSKELDDEKDTTSDVGRYTIGI